MLEWISESEYLKDSKNSDTQAKINHFIPRCACVARGKDELFP